MAANWGRAIIPALCFAGVAAANPCDTTAAPMPAPTPAPTPGCSDKPSDWKSNEGSTCADYGAKQWCTADGGYGSGWKDEWGKFDKWAGNGVSADVACCVCGGGSTGSGPCDTTPAPGPAPAPAPVPAPGCSDKPSDWKSNEGSTCADYAAKQWCTADGGYGSGWKDEWGKFDKWAGKGVSADVACCACGGGSTVSGKQACQGHSYDNNACMAVGCCYYSTLFGCRANDKDSQCYGGSPCDTTVAPGDNKPGKGKIVGGLIAGGVIAGAIGAAVAAKSTTTAGPVSSTTATGSQSAQTTTAPPVVTTTTENSSSSLLWLWILLGILGLCCLLALCGGGLAAMMGGKKKKKKTRSTRVSQPAPAVVAEPAYVQEEQELLPMVPPLLEPYPMMPMAAPTMVETVQMTPVATPTMVETAVPMMQMAAPTMVDTAVPMMQMAAPTAVSTMPGMQVASPAVPAMPMMGSAMQGIGGYGTQALPAMGGVGFGTQAMPGIL